MAFHIHGVASGQMEFNDQRLGLYTLGELGTEDGLKVETILLDYKHGILRIMTKLMVFLEHNEEIYWLAKCTYISIFEMDEPEIFKRGASKRAIGMLKECCDLNQAHAYGQFYHMLEKNDLPLIPSQLQPIEGFQSAFQDFLAKHNDLKKRK
ncbi:hypothetical protein L0663_25880 [Dyadobacter sp. CY107]|uniref:hypothetical protein n=1 Tax=Dyadobacter fanqingshengii TaxID=2906443 RepID=UPI001F3D05C3|nr:hypothetical protein [Dyadobacter fanqingshengii]MCF2506846.1 hypothetical protein [Dyadobacter fanqingshengii]